MKIREARPTTTTKIRLGERGHGDETAEPALRAPHHVVDHNSAELDELRSNSVNPTASLCNNRKADLGGPSNSRPPTFVVANGGISVICRTV